jgi:hypothetical protein
LSTNLTNSLTLRYRTSFLIFMILGGLFMSVAGPLIVILAVVVFRPPGIFLGVMLALSGIRLLRRYWKSFLRRQAAFQLDEEGLHYVAADGYSIAWSSVLGLHAVRRGNRVTDIYFYLSENPGSSLFVGETDPRAAAFAGHHAESPNQLHLRLSHFDTKTLEDVEAAFRVFAPRQGAFPNGARILNGHLSSLNVLLFSWVMTILFGGLFGGIAVSVSTWAIGFFVFAVFQIIGLLVWGIGRLNRLRSGWATPRLIASGGMLYLPGTALGSVSFNDILNVRYGWSGLGLFFKTCQEAVRDFQYNPYGLSTNIMIRTQGQTRQEMEQFFSKGQIWNNGKMPDFKQAREQKRQDDAEVKRIMRNFKNRPIDRLPE